MTLLDYYYIVLLIALTSGFLYKHLMIIENNKDYYYEGIDEYLEDESLYNPLVILEDICDTKEIHILFRLPLAILGTPIIWLFCFSIVAFSRYFWKKLYRKIVEFLM